MYFIILFLIHKIKYGKKKWCKHTGTVYVPSTWHSINSNASKSVMIRFPISTATNTRRDGRCNKLIKRQTALSNGDNRSRCYLIHTLLLSAFSTPVLGQLSWQHSTHLFHGDRTISQTPHAIPLRYWGTRIWHKKKIGSWKFIAG